MVGGSLASEASYDIAIDDAQQNDIGLWIDGTSVSMYLLDEEIDTFVEPAIAGVHQIGVSMLGGPESQCAFDYLSQWTG